MVEHLSAAAPVRRTTMATKEELMLLHGIPLSLSR